MTILFPGLGIPTNPAITAGQIKGGRAKTEGSDNLRTCPDQIAQLCPHKGSAFKRVQPSNKPVPDQVFGMVGNEPHAQIGDLLDRTR